MMPVGMKAAFDEVLKISNCGSSDKMQCIYDHQLRNSKKERCIIIEIEMLVKIAPRKCFSVNFEGN